MDDYMELYNKTGSWLGKCPQCQNPALYNCGVSRNDVTCPICGYSFCLEILWDQTTQERKLTNSNRSMIRIKETKGTGVMWVERNEDYPGDFICLSRGVTQQVIDVFNHHLSEHGTDPEKSYLTSWDEETKTVNVVKGKVYNPFGDAVIEQDDYLDMYEFPSPLSLREPDFQIW